MTVALTHTAIIGC